MRIYRKLDDFKCGIGFGTFITVKMNFSNKDLLLLFGIIVAVIVTLTTIVYREGVGAQQETSQNVLKPKTDLVLPAGLIKKAIDQIHFNSLLR